MNVIFQSALIQLHNNSYSIIKIINKFRDEHIWRYPLRLVILIIACVILIILFSLVVRFFFILSFQKQFTKVFYTLKVFQKKPFRQKLIKFYRNLSFMSFIEPEFQAYFDEYQKLVKNFNVFWIKLNKILSYKSLSLKIKEMKKIHQRLKIFLFQANKLETKTKIWFEQESELTSYIIKFNKIYLDLKNVFLQPENVKLLQSYKIDDSKIFEQVDQIIFKLSRAASNWDYLSVSQYFLKLETSLFILINILDVYRFSDQMLYRHIPHKIEKIEEILKEKTSLTLNEYQKRDYLKLIKLKSNFMNLKKQSFDLFGQFQYKKINDNISAFWKKLVNAQNDIMKNKNFIKRTLNYELVVKEKYLKLKTFYQEFTNFYLNYLKKISIHEPHDEFKTIIKKFNNIFKNTKNYFQNQNQFGFEEKGLRIWQLLTSFEQLFNLIKNKWSATIRHYEERNQILIDMNYIESIILQVEIKWKKIENLHLENKLKIDIGPIFEEMMLLKKEMQEKHFHINRKKVWLKKVSEIKEKATLVFENTKNYLLIHLMARLMLDYNYRLLLKNDIDLTNQINQAENQFLEYDFSGALEASLKISYRNM